MSVSSTKHKRLEHIKISLHGSKQVTKKGSNLREMIMIDSGTTINQSGNPNIIKNILKSDTPMNLLTNAGLKKVDEVRQITGSVQK